MIEPPVILWVMSRSPGFMLSILAGWVCLFISIVFKYQDKPLVEKGKPSWHRTLEYLQHLKKGVMRTKPTL